MILFCPTVFIHHATLLGYEETLIITTGITFSPDGSYAYVTDTGINHGFFGYNLSDPSSM